MILLMWDTENDMGIFSLVQREKQRGGGVGENV